MAKCKRRMLSNQRRKGKFDHGVGSMSSEHYHWKRWADKLESLREINDEDDNKEILSGSKMF